MKHKTDIIEYIQNFDNELETKKDWLNAHINIMYIETHQLIDTIFIFQTIDTEWYNRVDNKRKIKYSEIRGILYESLSYKIFLGLSKIFVGEKEYSLPKAINVISQLDEFKNNKDIKALIQKIRNFLETSETIKIIATFRDQFYAHLDKICVISDCRIDSTIPMKKIDINEIKEGASLIGELYKLCFNEELKYSHNFSKQRIIDAFFGN